jgi:hypothetical protein
MARSRWILAVVVLGALLLAPSPSGSLPAPQADRQRAQRLLEALRQQFPDVSREIGWLENALPAAGAIPNEVLQALQDLHDARAAAQKLPEAERRRFLELSARDITLKAEFCRKHPQGMAALLDVVVRTWRPGDGERIEAARWNVAYLSAPMAVFPDRKGRTFPGFSSPSQHRLPPGTYVVWAEDPADAARRGPRKEVQIGDPTQTDAAPVAVDIVVAGGSVPRPVRPQSRR